jgi:nitrate/TMAO reductase-like tetraheme cytochrome c subunit
MSSSSRGWQVVGFTAGLLLLATSAFAQRTPKPPKAPDNDTCLACHGDPAFASDSGRKVGLDPEKFAGSVHGQLGLACVDCHKDLKATSDFPHVPKLARVDCSTCHADASAAYNRSIHAFARRQNTASVAATCADCHTAHEIRPAKDPQSTTYALNLPGTCSACHGNPSIIKAGHIAIGDVAALYKDSIHGRAVSKSGLLVAANCTSCHGHHDIRQKSDPGSRVNRANIPDTCGTCHEGIKTQYASGVHGAAFAKGDVKAPVCADCHSAHGIQRADTASWQLDVIRECGTCHVKRIETYRDTFHGQVTSLGFVRVATCAACHGAHAILPSTDDKSRTAPANVVKTCQQAACHPNATASFAKYDPHADKHDYDRNPGLFLSASFMKWLLIGTFGFFGLHAVLWFPRGFAERRRNGRNGHGATAEADKADRS